MKLTDVGNFRRRLMPGVPALLAIALAFSPMPASADHHLKDIRNCQTIDQSGSYVLVKNMEAQGDCLVITASFVNIDLSGFTISGNRTGRGITNGESNATNITIRNGSVTAFSDGILFITEGTVGGGYIIEAVRSSRNRGSGIFIIVHGVPGDSVVRNNIASQNASGILLTARDASDNLLLGGFSVIGNATNDNSNFGMDVDCPSTVLNNVATGNGVVQIRAQGVCTTFGNSPPL